LISRPGLFNPDVEASLIANGKEIVEGATLATIFKGMLAGWLIALMVWILPGASSARLFVIILLTYVVSLGHFPHIVAGSTEAAYAVFSGDEGFSAYFLGFLLPTLFGNTVGGVALAAILNHVPIAHEIASENSNE
jgi:formate/nitrite transporter FocA (FNT family)